MHLSRLLRLVETFGLLQLVVNIYHRYLQFGFILRLLYCEAHGSVSFLLRDQLLSLMVVLELPMGT